MKIQELKKRLNIIKKLGYVASKRKGNTGIGYTLETLLGVKENNLKIPDLGKIEIKSQRKNASTPVTMLTFNKGVWKINQKEFIQRYGYIDSLKRHALYCTVASNPNNQGLYLSVKNKYLYLFHINGELIAEWQIKNLIDTFKNKMPAAVIVYADTRINSEDKEEFHFNEAYLLKTPNQNNFIDLIKKDIIIVDIRMHLNKNFTVRNHGTAFRISENFLYLCFKIKEKLI